MEEYKDICWSVEFEITINGESVRFADLSETAREYILACIDNDSYSGTFLD